MEIASFLNEIKLCLGNPQRSQKTALFVYETKIKFYFKSSTRVMNLAKELIFYVNNALVALHSGRSSVT